MVQNCYRHGPLDYTPILVRFNIGANYNLSDPQEFRRYAADLLFDAFDERVLAFDADAAAAYAGLYAQRRRSGRPASSRTTPVTATALVCAPAIALHSASTSAATVAVGRMRLPMSTR